MSKRNACDTGLLHKKTVKRRVTNELLMEEKVKELRVMQQMSCCSQIVTPLPAHQHIC
jgi:hypothetical protein